MKPEIKRALDEIKKGQNGSESDDDKIQDLMDSAGMSVERQLERLENFQADGQGSPALQFQAIKLGLQISGVLKEAQQNGATIPSIQIIIEDPTAVGKINPILIPRPSVKPNEMKIQ